MLTKNEKLSGNFYGLMKMLKFTFTCAIYFYIKINDVLSIMGSV